MGVGKTPTHQLLFIHRCFERFGWVLGCFAKNLKKGRRRNEIAESSIASAQEIIVEHSRWIFKHSQLVEVRSQAPHLLMNRDFDSDFSILSHIAILSLSSKIEMVNRAAINPIIKSNPNSFDSKWKE